MPDLSDRDKDVLDFERMYFRYQGAKESMIRERFGFSLTRYAQVLNALIDRPEALAYSPTTVKRLQRLRTLRRSRHMRVS